MKRYRLSYQVPYLFDDGGSDGKDLYWGSETFDFDADGDDEARVLVLEQFAKRTVELKDKGTVETWHYSINRLEEMPRDIPLPDLPMNGKQVV